MNTIRPVKTDSIPKDSMTCIFNSQFRAAIRDIELGKIAVKENAVLRDNINLLNERIFKKDSVNNVLKHNDTTSQMIINTKTGELLIANKIISNQGQQLTVYSRRLKFAKGFKWILMGIGAIGGYFIATIVI